ncbi:MAG: DUF3299 domain-containing protein [Planctomycetota bacterium]
MSPLTWIAAAAISLLPSSSTLVDPTEVDFATLSGFDFKQGMDLPSEITAYNGTEIKVSGFMATEDGSPGPVSEFLLINDACGCEGTPKINEVIFCYMADGSQVEIDPGVVSVTGTLDVGEEVDYGVVLSLYRMEVTQIDT